MRKEINLHKRKVEYTLKVSKSARRVRLAVYCDGKFVVTAPRHADLNIVEKFIIQKSKWILDKIDSFRSFSNLFKSENSKNEYIKYKNDAHVLVEKKIEKFNKIYKFKFNKINIKNQKTRWGSCSKKGNLNFNYKIVLLPEKLADYIVVHELCHLGQFNHSNKFWNLVAKAIPDYLNNKEDLKKIDLQNHC